MSDSQAIERSDAGGKRSAVHRFIGWVDGHPWVKIAVYAAGVAAFLLNVAALADDHIFARQREKVQQSREAKLAGTDVDPPVFIQFDGLTCAMENKHSRAVAETSLHFGKYLVDITAESVIEQWGGVAKKPAERIRLLEPGDTIKARFPEDNETSRCGVSGCPAGHHCVAVRQCIVRYHREADRQKYDAEDYAFVQATDTGCLFVQAGTPMYFDLAKFDPSLADMFKNDPQTIAWKLTAEQRKNSHEGRILEPFDYMKIKRIE